MIPKLKSERMRLHASQGMKFITCGLLGAVMEFSILKVLVGHYQVTPFIAYLPSALIPATFVFFFNKHVTFRASGRTAEQTKRFVMVYVVAFCTNYLLSSLLYSAGSSLVTGQVISGIELTDARVAYLAKAMAIGITAVFNYCFSHFFIFRKEKAVLLESDMAVL
jgi:putative flippase GtrA